jgi:hypothetical protein
MNNELRNAYTGDVTAESIGSPYRPDLVSEASRAIADVAELRRRLRWLVVLVALLLSTVALLSEACFINARRAREDRAAFHKHLADEGLWAPACLCPSAP